MKLQLQKAHETYEELHSYEVCCLVNFVDSASTREEILSLVPSLQRFTENEVDRAISVVVDSKRKFDYGL